MFTDPVRTPAYLAAIARVVKPGDVVIEIGTGVGFFAVAACRAGAKHVYAIEMNPSVAVAHEVLAANGCADRVTVMQEQSSRVTLPERGDVLLEDMRGVLPLDGGHIAAVIDARARLLRDGAPINAKRCIAWRNVAVAKLIRRFTGCGPQRIAERNDRGTVAQQSCARVNDRGNVPAIEWQYAAHVFE